MFLVMTVFGAFLLKNPPAGYKPAGWMPAPASKTAATTYEFSARRSAAHSDVLLDVVCLRARLRRRSDGDQPAGALREERGHPHHHPCTMGLVVGAVGNASGRILSGWMSDHLGRINVLRLMIAISMMAMPVLYFVGGNVVALFVMVFIVYWCYGTQLSVNAATAADFWGTKNVGINYGMLFTAWGVAGLLGGPGSAEFCTTSTTIIRWRSTPQQLWQR